MTWEIIIGIITLFGFLVSVVTPIAKLTKIMTELTDSVQSLKEAINEIGTKNTESHRRIWEHNTEQDQTLENHEKRITKLEYDVDKYHNYHPEHHNE